MDSTRHIIKKLSLPLANVKNKLKVKDKLKVKSHSRSYYLRKIASLHAQGIIESDVVFVRMLNQYVEDYSSRHHPNVQIAKQLIKFASDIEAYPDKFTGVSYMLSVINRLNNSKDHFEEDNLIAVIGAFFSTYEMHRFHLSETTKEKFKIVDAWKLYLNSEMKKLSKKMRRKKEKRGVIFPEYKKAEYCKILMDFSTCILLDELPRRIVKALLHYAQDENPHVRREATRTLVLCREKIPVRFNPFVVASILKILKCGSAKTIREACVLLGGFYHLLPEGEQPDAFQFYLRAVLMPHWYIEDIPSFASITELLPKEKLREVVVVLLELLHVPRCIQFNIDIQSARYEMFELILRLRNRVSDTDKAFITNALAPYLKGKVKEFKLERIKCKSLQWLYENEKMAIQQPLMRLMTSSSSMSRVQGFKMLVTLGVNGASQDALLNDLLHRLQLGTSYKVDIDELSMIGQYLSSEQQKPFVDYLLASIYPDNVTSRHHRLSPDYRLVAALANMGSAIANNERRRFVLTVIQLLMCGEDLLESKACEALVKLVPIVPGDLYEYLIDQLMLKLYGYSASDASRVLSRLANYLPKDQCQRTAITLFELASDTLADISALAFYLPYLDYDLKVSMLSRLSCRHSFAGQGRLFSLLYNAHQADLASDLMRRIEIAPAFYAPPEVVENIIRYAH